MTGPCAVCNSPADHICSGCRITNYCNREHQKQHWKTQHKGNCKPLFKVENDPQLGRHLVSTRDIKKGELILQESPLISGPKSFSHPTCLGCHNICDPSKYHECDGCGFPLCSVQCQVSDNHFDECRLMMDNKYRAQIDMKSSEREIAYMPIVPLRCILLKDKQPEKFKKILDLQSHLEERQTTSLFQVYKNNVCAFIRDRLGMKNIEEKLILNILGVLDTNAFEVRTKTSKYRGLYSAVSMIAHDCQPNTRHTFHGKDAIIAVSATRDIKQGESITATYTQTFWSTLVRREHLKLAKCFDCTCQRCADPTELGTYIGAIRCTRCVTADNFQNGPYITSTAPLDSKANWACNNCGHSVPARLIKSGNDDLKREISSLDKTSAGGLEDFLMKYGANSAGVLHPRNTHVVQVKHALLQMYGNAAKYKLADLPDDLLERKLDYCHELLEIVDILEPGHSRIRGQLLNELQSTMAVLAKRHYQQDKITKEAAQQTLTDAMVILSEVVDILKIEPEIEEITESLATLSKEF